MSAIVEWEKQALNDREKIFRYLYREAGLLVASAADDKFVGLVNILKENPQAGIRAGKKNNQRKLVVPYFPFIIVYVAEVVTISILRILHTSRKTATRFRRV